ncbi:hypothetical protein ACOMHN_008906 [Nucella lapillus]
MGVNKQVDSLRARRKTSPSDRAPRLLGLTTATNKRRSQQKAKLQPLNLKVHSSVYKVLYRAQEICNVRKRFGLVYRSLQQTSHIGT